MQRIPCLKGHPLIMKKIYLLLLAASALVACKKETTSTPVTGKWELVRINNRLLGASIPKPSISGTESFHIVFEPGGGYNGNTFRNTFDGSYRINTTDKSLYFDNVVFTLIGEDTWGRPFKEMTFSCLLQSLAPCIPVYYETIGDTLILKEPSLYDFYLVPLR